MLDELQDAAERDLGDDFTFTVGQPQNGGIVGPPEGGHRFHVTVFLGSRFAEFKLDVGQGDVLVAGIERLSPVVDLTFTGLETRTSRAIRQTSTSPGSCMRTRNRASGAPG